MHDKFLATATPLGRRNKMGPSVMNVKNEKSM